MNRTEQCSGDCRIGVGVTAEQDNLFRPFYRSEEVRRLRPQGTGFGLAVAHRIVAVLEGEITAAPNDPRGTTFLLRFALAPSVPRDHSPLEADMQSQPIIHEVRYANPFEANFNWRLLPT